MTRKAECEAQQRPAVLRRRAAAQKETPRPVLVTARRRGRYTDEAVRSLQTHNQQLRQQMLAVRSQVHTVTCERTSADAVEVQKPCPTVPGTQSFNLYNGLPTLFLDLFGGLVGKSCLWGRVETTTLEIFLYADDTALLFEGESWEEVRDVAERGLLTVKRWFDQCRLTVNIAKTKCMPISIRADGDPFVFKLRLHTCGGQDG
ncbi:hypothetical protein J6590_072746 [Homalodisca vitripennis]|nr:hypothetical protein J6590_072746 [Homalodisca vitripennis]